MFEIFVISMVILMIVHLWEPLLLKAPGYTARVKVTKKEKINGICYAVFEFPDGLEKVFVVRSRLKTVQENEMIVITYKESENARTHKYRFLVSFEKDTALDV